MERTYYVKQVLAMGFGYGCLPPTLEPATKEDGEGFIRVKVNQNYRIFLLSWSYGTQELWSRLLAERSSYEEAYLVYQQQHQFLHGEGPFDYRTNKNPQIPVEGVERLVEDLDDDEDDLINHYIGILNETEEHYFNFSDQ